jgi:hypothetical protein
MVSFLLGVFGQKPLRKTAGRCTNRFGRISSVQDKDGREPIDYG